MRPAREFTCGKVCPGLVYVVRTEQETVAVCAECETSTEAHCQSSAVLRECPADSQVYTAPSSKPRLNAVLTYWAFTRSDRRTDRSVRPKLRPTVCQTSRTDRLDRL